MHIRGCIFPSFFCIYIRYFLCMKEGGYFMPKVRKETPELENWCMSKKKFVRYAEGAQLYSMGLHIF